MMFKTVIIALVATFVQAETNVEVVSNAEMASADAIAAMAEAATWSYSSYCPFFNAAAFRVAGQQFRLLCDSDIRAGGGDVFSKTTENAEDCAGLCLVHGDTCRGVTWNPDTKGCYGKAFPAEILSSPGALILVRPGRGF